MTGKLIQIGNSQGLRIPKSLILKYKLKNELTLVETENGILIQSSKPRDKWRELILAEGSKNTLEDDTHLLDIENEFDKNEWTW